MKSKELKTHNLPSDEVLISTIDAKPYFLFVILIILGIISYLFSISIFYGTLLIIVSIVVLLFTPKITLMEFYQNFLVMYNKADKNSCVLIYYDEVVSWYYTKSTNHDYLYIELQDGNTERIETFSKTVFESNMNRFLKDKKKASK